MTRRKPSINPLARWLHSRGYAPLTIAKVVRHATEEWTISGIEPGILKPDDAKAAEEVLADSQPESDFDSEDWGSAIGESGSMWNGLDDRWKAGPDPCHA